MSNSDHLPAAVANELTEVGVPAAPTPVVRRNVPPSMWALKRRTSNAVAPEGEHGWLTPIRKSQGDPQYWFWRCRCGDEKTLRPAKAVRSCLKRGATPKCAACDLAERKSKTKASREGTKP